MPDSHDDPTEVSPLLRKQSNVATEPIDAPTRALPNNGSIRSQSDGNVKNGEDEERQEEEVTEYQGMPEVKAKLKYILPALAIGIFLSAADQTLIVTMYGKIGSDLKALNKTSWVSTA